MEARSKAELLEKENLEIVSKLALKEQDLDRKTQEKVILNIVDQKLLHTGLQKLSLWEQFFAVSPENIDFSKKLFNMKNLASNFW